MPKKYVPFFPDTVQGQAILNNFVRSRRFLKYRDNDKVFDNIRRGMPFYEVEKMESIGSNQKNMLIRGECISACAFLKEQEIKIDLVYIDPPFASGADYAKKVYIRRNPKVAEAIKKAEEELDVEELRSFEEKMYGDIWNKESYLNWMYENLLAIKSVMSDTASIYVHLDWHIGHYVKVLMDEVFGEDNFLNEIIWAYKERESSLNYYNRKHDSIYYYIRNVDSGYTFNYNDIRDEYSETTIGKFKYTDNSGRKYRLRYKDGRNDPTEEDDYTYRQYFDEADGTLPRDWFIMPIVNQAANERQDYATQKPEALLERIIKASSNENMVVADFFGGSGVCAKVANDLKRNFIHVDIGINSIQTTRDRLKSANAEFDVYEIKDGINLFRNPVQTMEKLKKFILGLQNEDGLDKFWEGAISDSKLGTVPVYLPNLLDHTTKVLDIPLMNRIINEAIPDLPDETKKVIVFYVDIDDEKSLNKFIEEQNVLVEIELRDLKQILDDTVIEDIAEYKIKEKKDIVEIEITKFISDRLRQKISEFNQKGLLQPDKLISDSEESTDNNSEDERNTDDTPKPKKKKFTPIEISKQGLELIEYISLDCTNPKGIWKSDKEIKIDKNGYVIEDGKKSKTFWDAKIRCTQKPKRMKIRNIAGDETIIEIGG